jgi:hypothetical protein
VGRGTRPSKSAAWREHVGQVPNHTLCDFSMVASTNGAVVGRLATNAPPTQAWKTRSERFGRRRTATAATDRQRIGGTQVIHCFGLSLRVQLPRAPMCQRDYCPLAGFLYWPEERGCKKLTVSMS